MLTKEQEEIIDNINESLKTINTDNETRFKKLELASDKGQIERKRLAEFTGPGNGEKRNPGGIEYKATTDEEKAFFDTYLRKGQKFLNAEEQKTLILGSDVAAGYLAPEGYARTIIKGVAEWSPIRENAKVVPITEKSMDFPKKTGTFDAGWVSEIAERTETAGLTYGMETMTPAEMYAFVKISNHMLEDSAFSLESELAIEFAERFGVLEGTAFILGDAVGKPEGILTNADVGEVISGDATLIKGDGLINLIYGVKRGYRKAAKFYANDATIATIRLLKDDYGRYLFIDPVAGEPPRLLGYPVVSCPDLPDVGAGLYPVIFGDMRRAYQITDRIQMSVQRLAERYAEFGIVGFMARRRVDGQVVLAEAIVKQKISAT